MSSVSTRSSGPIHISILLALNNNRHNYIKVGDVFWIFHCGRREVRFFKTTRVKN